jgi:hypothetical protein
VEWRILIIALIACSGWVGIVTPAEAHEAASITRVSALRSWITADSHIHSAGCGAPFRSASEIFDLMLGAGINVGDILVWGPSWNLDHDRFSGADDPVSTPSNILRYDLEISGFPASQLGHLVALGLSSIDFVDELSYTPRSGVPIVDWALAQDPPALVGADHGQTWGSPDEYPRPEGCCIPYEFPVHVARDHATFLSTQKFDSRAWALWSKLQNSGFRVPIMAGSDYPCIANNELGLVRTHVEIDEPLTFDNYLDAIRAGRTVAAHSLHGWMTLIANGVGLGEEVQLVSGESLFVTLETDFPVQANVQILYNGELVAPVVGGAGVGSANIDFIPTESGWLVAKGSKIWTSPIYVLVDALPIRPSADDACYMARYVEYLETLVDDELFDDLGDDYDDVMAAYEEARGVFLLRFLEAGGTSCKTIRTAQPGKFCIGGTGDGGDWSWQVDNFSPIVVPGSPTETQTSDLRDAFVTSINDAPPPLSNHLSASVGPGPVCFTVSYNTSFQFFAGPDSFPVDCLVTGNRDGCFFSATIYEEKFLVNEVPSMTLSMLVLMGSVLLAVSVVVLLSRTSWHQPSE